MNKRTRSASARVVTAGAVAVALGLGSIAGAAPAMAAEKTVSDAVFEWSINNESGGGAFFGGCNFLSAGVAGNTESSRPWTQNDGFYKTTDGNTKIVKIDGNQEATPTWADKCKTIAGTTVTSGNAAQTTGNTVRMSAGEGTVDPLTGEATIEWDGAFTVAFYGGMTYWSATDPVLTVDAQGTGTLTATASGYGADRDDPSIWNPLPQQKITLATLKNVEVDSDGFTVTPDYVGVTVTGTSQTASSPSNSAYWGSFPQSFVDYQALTGQSSYWYTSGGARDVAKPANPLKVSYTAQTAPTAITTQPQNAAVGLGEKATFSVAATGEALSYSWERSTNNGDTWSAVSGADAATYEVTGTSANAAQYRVVVTGEAGSVTSNAATLVVNVPTPTVTVSKTAGLDPAGETVTVTGSGFLPNSPATSGSRPPLANKFTGSYIVFGRFADVWKPSESAASTARSGSSAATKWGVLAEDMSAVGGSADGAIEITADGTFETSFTVEKNYSDKVPSTGNYGVYTYAGGGAKYAPFETYTPITFSVPVADAPAKPTATLTDGDSVTVEWIAPDDNGEAITGYDVSLKPATGDASVQTVVAGTTTAVFDGLTPGVSYTATVVAKNAGGSSAASPASDAVTVPATVPAAPAKPTATAAGTTSINVSWVAPANGGSDITGYTVNVFEGDTKVTSVDATATSAVVTGLERSAGYTVSVVAKNAVGSSSASPSASVTTLAEVPGTLAAPTLSAVSGTEVSVAWAPATDDGGSPITGYIVKVYNGTTEVDSVTAAADSSSATISGLARGTSYTATVTAKNAEGAGTPSPASSAVTTLDVPGVPTSVAATSEGRNVIVTWGAPVSTGGAAVSGYTVTLSAGGAQVQQKSAASDATSTEFENLIPGTAYTATVTATNSVGVSASAEASATAAAVAPDAPAVPTIEVTAGDSVTVRWVNPTFDGGSPVTGYDVTLSNDDDSATESVDAATRELAFEGLPAGKYTATVTAKNAVGSTESDASAAADVAGPAPEDAPTLLTEFDGETDGNIEVTIEGNTATIDAGSEHANEWIGVSVHSTPVFLGWFFTNALGNVSVTLPTDLPAGTHHLVAYATDGSVIGYDSFQIAAAGSGEGSAPGVTSPTGIAGQGQKMLSNTGAEVSALVIAALALLVLGAGVVTARVVAQRSRRQHSES